MSQIKLVDFPAWKVITHFARYIHIFVSHFFKSFIFENEETRFAGIHGRRIIFSHCPAVSFILLPQYDSITRSFRLGFSFELKEHFSLFEKRQRWTVLLTGDLDARAKSCHSTFSSKANLLFEYAYFTRVMSFSQRQHFGFRGAVILIYVVLKFGCCCCVF